MFEEEVSEEYKSLNEDQEPLESCLNTTEKHSKSGVKNQEVIAKYLGKGPRSVEVYETKWYYWKLLAWTVKCIFASAGWKTISVYGYSSEQPIYRNIQIDYTKFESCLIDGQMLVEKDGVRFVITVTSGSGLNYTTINASLEHQEQVKQIAQEIADFQKKNNFYRGKRICLSDDISFLNGVQKEWNFVILDPKLKKELRLNTVDFLKCCDKWEKYGIPLRRGIILAGEPGTGKTVICKALMSEADNITCISTDAYWTMRTGYISDLFSLAQDLSPTMVFIEDIDFIGQERQGSYRGTPILISLLAEMDGIEEKKAIVVVATSNCVETLDKALSERPSRFDRIFKIGMPTLQQRTELLEHLSRKNLLSAEIIEYIVKKTDGFTPAQLQEVVHGMVISRVGGGEETMEFTRSDVDSIISLINYRRTGKIGFNALLQ